MKRGIVMQVSGRHCIVMTSDGEFRKIHRTAASKVGEEIGIDTPRIRSTRFMPLWMPAVAVLLLLVVLPRLWTFETAHAEVVAYVSMDINPSLEMGIDQEERVVELKAWNKDGADLIDGLTYKGQPADKVTAAIMEKVQEHGYLASGAGDVVITSVMVNENKISAQFEQTLTDKMDHAVEGVISRAPAGSNTVKVTVLNAPKELREVSKAKGVSPGKMAVYLLAQEEGRKVPLDVLKQESINQATQEWGGLESIVGTKAEAKANKERLKQLAEAEKDKQKAQDQKENNKKKKKKNKQHKDNNQTDLDQKNKNTINNRKSQAKHDSNQTAEPAKDGKKDKLPDKEPDKLPDKEPDKLPDKEPDKQQGKQQDKREQSEDRRDDRSNTKPGDKREAGGSVKKENKNDRDSGEHGNEKKVSNDRPIDVKPDEKSGSHNKENNGDKTKDKKSE